jgi:hypothetical protein
MWNRILNPEFQAFVGRVQEANEFPPLGGHPILHESDLCHRTRQLMCSVRTPIQNQGPHQYDKVWVSRRLQSFRQSDDLFSATLKLNSHLSVPTSNQAACRIYALSQSST